MGKTTNNSARPADIDPPTPPLAYRARLDELDGCWLHITCGQCGRITTPAIKFMINTIGPHHQLGAILPRLICKSCKTPPATVHLGETHMTKFVGGGDPGWSVQLVPPALNG